MKEVSTDDLLSFSVSFAPDISMKEVSIEDLLSFSVSVVCEDPSLSTSPSL